MVTIDSLITGTCRRPDRRHFRQLPEGRSQDVKNEEAVQGVWGT